MFLLLVAMAITVGALIGSGSRPAVSRSDPHPLRRSGHRYRPGGGTISTRRAAHDCRKTPLRRLIQGILVVTTPKGHFHLRGETDITGHDDAELVGTRDSAPGVYGAAPDRHRLFPAPGLATENTYEAAFVAMASDFRDGGAFFLTGTSFAGNAG